MSFSLFARVDLAGYSPEELPRLTQTPHPRLEMPHDPAPNHGLGSTSNRLRLLGVPRDRLKSWEATDRLMRPLPQCGGQAPIKCEGQTQTWESSRPRTTKPEDDPKFGRVGLYGFIQGKCDSCGPNRCEPTALVIFVDGACPHNGSPWATESSYGVFFGDSGTAATRNISNKIHRDTHTNQQAELIGAIAALEAVKPFVMGGGHWPPYRGANGDDTKVEWPRVKQVILRSDSTYVVEGINEHIHKWKKNGWRNVNDERVANKDLWLQLLDEIAEVKKLGANRIAFNWIPREQNQDAHNLAAAALYPSI